MKSLLVDPDVARMKIAVEPEAGSRSGTAKCGLDFVERGSGDGFVHLLERGRNAAGVEQIVD